MADRRLEIVLAARDVTGKALAGVTGRLQQLARGAFSLQGAFAALAGTAGIGLVVKNSLELNDRLAKTSDKLGITTEALAGLRQAAELTGVASNTLDMALQRMVRRVAEAAQGTGEARGALQELGIDAQRLAQLAPEKQFAVIADAMNRVTNQTDKVRLAFKLFDSEGVAVVNTLRLGSEGLREAALEADRLGVAISRVEASRIEEANDAMLRLNQALSGLGTTLTVAIAPTITQIAESTSAWVAANNELIKTGLPEFIDKATTAFSKYVEMLKLAYKWHPANVMRRLGQGAYDYFNPPQSVPPELEAAARQSIAGATPTPFVPYAPSFAGAATAGGGTAPAGTTTTAAAMPYMPYAPFSDRAMIGQDMIDSTESTFQQIEQVAERHFSTIGNIATSAGFTMQNAFTDFFDATSAGFLDLRQLARDVMSSVSRNITSNLVGALFNSFGAGPTQPFLPGMSFNNGGYIGENVAGFGMSSGKSYEFHADEFVVPRGKTGGGTTINNYISTLDAKSFKQAFGAQVIDINAQALDDNHQRLWSSLGRRR